MATKDTTVAVEEVPADIARGREKARQGGFTRYRVDCVFRNMCMGGIPKNPKVIEAWLGKRTGVKDDEELRLMTRRTLLEQGVETPEEASLEEMYQALKAVSAEMNTNGFAHDQELGLVLGSRALKAMLKECTAIAFPWPVEKWGVTKKAARSYLAERVYVQGDWVPLGRKEPDGIQLVIGHVSGASGDKSTLTYHEFTRFSPFSFVALSFEDCIKPDQWEVILELAQESGLGALRSQGYGRFDVQDIARLDPAKRGFSFPR